MRTSIPPFRQYAFKERRSVKKKAQGQLYLLHSFLPFYRSFVWLSGDRNRVYIAKVIYVHCYVVAWQPCSS